MDKLFDKNSFKDFDGKIKLIIDCDPGVDDTACLTYALFDENIDVKLLTTVVGNINLDTATRNLLHILDLYNKDIPVAVGAKRALKRISPTAEFIHQKEGMGGYTPKPSNRKVLEEDAVEAIYKTIMAGDGDIYIVALGPQTNIASLLIKHPEVIKKIPKIVFMGGSPYNNPDYPQHISFNLSSDPDAFKIVLESGIPLLMCSSHMGRYKAHLTEDFVYSLENYGDVGKFLFKMYTKYWEPRFSDKRITTNDTCCLFALVYPKMFKFKKVNVKVDTEIQFGRTDIDFCDKGCITFIDDLDRNLFLDFLTSELKKLSDIKLNF